MFQVDHIAARLFFFLPTQYTMRGIHQLLAAGGSLPLQTRRKREESKLEEQQRHHQQIACVRIAHQLFASKPSVEATDGTGIKHTSRTICKRKVLSNNHTGFFFFFFFFLVRTFWHSKCFLIIAEEIATNKKSRIVADNNNDTRHAELVIDEKKSKAHAIEKNSSSAVTALASPSSSFLTIVNESKPATTIGNRQSSAMRAPRVASANTNSTRTTATMAVTLESLKTELAMLEQSLTQHGHVPESKKILLQSPAERCALLRMVSKQTDFASGGTCMCCSNGMVGDADAHEDDVDNRYDGHSIAPSRIMTTETKETKKPTVVLSGPMRHRQQNRDNENDAFVDRVITNAEKVQLLAGIDTLSPAQGRWPVSVPTTNDEVVAEHKIISNKSNLLKNKSNNNNNKKKSKKSKLLICDSTWIGVRRRRKPKMAPEAKAASEMCPPVQIILTRKLQRRIPSKKQMMETNRDNGDHDADAVADADGAYDDMKSSSLIIGQPLCLAPQTYSFRKVAVQNRHDYGVRLPGSDARICLPTYVFDSIVEVHDWWNPGTSVIATITVCKVPAIKSVCPEAVASSSSSSSSSSSLSSSSKKRRLRCEYLRVIAPWVDVMRHLTVQTRLPERLHLRFGKCDAILYHFLPPSLEYVRFNARDR